MAAYHYEKFEGTDSDVQSMILEAPSAHQEVPPPPLIAQDAGATTENTGREAWYDAEIAPELCALAERCQARGMGFVAVVEYQPGCRGGTYYLGEGAGLEMRMLHFCAHTVPNVDSYIIALKRFANENNIDTTASWYLGH